jgi:hypothetical protein
MLAGTQEDAFLETGEARRHWQNMLLSVAMVPEKIRMAFLPTARARRLTPSWIPRT